MTLLSLWLQAVGATLGWALLVLDALPATADLIPDRLDVLAAVAAGVFSVCLLVRRLLIPGQEAFEAGRFYERRQMMKQRNWRATVVRLRRRDGSGNDLRPEGTG